MVHRGSRTLGITALAYQLAIVCSGDEVATARIATTIKIQPTPHIMYLRNIVHRIHQMNAQIYLIGSDVNTKRAFRNMG